MLLAAHSLYATQTSSLLGLLGLCIPRAVEVLLFEYMYGPCILLVGSGWEEDGAVVVLHRAHERLCHKRAKPAEGAVILQALDAAGGSAVAAAAAAAASAAVVLLMP